MKTIEAIAAFNAIVFLENTGRALPLRFSYAVARNRRKLREFAEVYEKQRQALLDKLAVRDEAGARVLKDGMVELTDRKAFDEDIKLLDEQDIEVNLHTVDLADFPSEIEQAIMRDLLAMVREKEEAGAAA